MEKEKKTRTVKLEKHEAVTFPMIVGEVKKSNPRLRTVKSKEKLKAMTLESHLTTGKCSTTCETSGNRMKLCVNLMPVLASAKEILEEEEEEEEEGKEEDNSCTSENEPENSTKKNPPVTKSEVQTPGTSDSYTGLTWEKAPETKQPQRPELVLPPLPHPKPALECCDHQKTKRCLTPLPPISLSEQATTFSPNITTKGCRGDGPVAGQVPDSRLWIDNPLFSKSRSAEFQLPDISLSSLETLLQTVTQKLGRKRRVCDEEPWRWVQSDQRFLAVSEQRLREKMAGQQISHCQSGEENPTNMQVCGAATETSVGGHSVNRQMRLPPLFSAPKPTLILTMTKKNLLMSNTLQ